MNKQNKTSKCAFTRTYIHYKHICLLLNTNRIDIERVFFGHTKKLHLKNNYIHTADQLKICIINFTNNTFTTHNHFATKLTIVPTRFIYAFRCCCYCCCCLFVSNIGFLIKSIRAQNHGNFYEITVSISQKAQMKMCSFTLVAGCV